jgi:hypothetical protein
MSRWDGEKKVRLRTGSVLDELLPIPKKDILKRTLFFISYVDTVLQSLVQNVICLALRAKNSFILSNRLNSYLIPTQREL